MWTRNGIAPWVHGVCHRMPKALSQLGTPKTSLSICPASMDYDLPLKAGDARLYTQRVSLFRIRIWKSPAALFFSPFCFTSFPSQRALPFNNFITLCGSLGLFSRFLLPPIWQSNSIGLPTKVLGTTLGVYVEKPSVGMGFSPGGKREATEARSTVSTASARGCIPNLATSLKLTPLRPVSSF